MKTTGDTSVNGRHLLARASTARGCWRNWWRKPSWEETKLGRAIGPCRPPAFWTTRTSALHHIRGMDKLQEHPPGDVFAAVSFPILQSNENGDLKLRRGEDWRRSAHNSTVWASDVPTHHFVGDFVDMTVKMA